MEADYLVIGAGLSGLAFVDELVRRSDASVFIADRRDAPGGHWNDAYPFVALHQPSSFYGVESEPLGEDRIEHDGPNAGFMSLAEGPEILHYCHRLVRERLVASGRVRFLPMTEWVGGSDLRGLLSGDRFHVDVRRRLVDATYYTNSVPLTHRRAFRCDDGVVCVPPNDLPRLAGAHRRFTILGGGKTALDACLWLLRHGVEPDRIRWVIPRDQWFVNRAKVQPGVEHFESVFGGFRDARNDMVAARSSEDLALRHEASGLWLRLDGGITPTVFHAAHVSPGELTELRRIGDVVRLGRVEEIGRSRVTLQAGTIPAESDTLYVDCTATALEPRAAVPVFEHDRIVLQAVRFPQIPFSAALIGFLESTFTDDDHKNSFCSPVPVVTSVDEYIRAMKPDLDNRLAMSLDPAVRAWVRSSRLDGFAKVAAAVDRDDFRRQSLLAEVKEATALAYRRLPALIATLPPPDASITMRAASTEPA